MLLFLQTAQAHVQLFEKHIRSLKSQIDTAGADGSHSSSSTESWRHVVSDLESLLESANKVSSSLSHCLTVFIQQEEVSTIIYKMQKFSVIIKINVR